ncbi:hypothetical protein SteCoe_1043 [Stentor coeruleus]|uniref:Uncharacterized protein n=1 Tax=Stentor coeruleus TaxID=5963 RepID=A0A1R2D2Y9_9CILI|nr:hypothetical protein SteCoe_1043 [Stentor coeruleus]
MYIGPWQEYKLAQVIRVKNDIYEGKTLKLSTSVLQKHDAINNTSQKFHNSTPSTRSFSSEPIQKVYPTFDLDIYYKQWKKVESIIAKSEAPHKKPPLPPQTGVRKRQGKSIQERRVNKMRQLYGIKNSDQNQMISKKNEIVVPQLSNLSKSPGIEKKTFPEKFRNDIKVSETMNFNEKKNIFEDDKKCDKGIFIEDERKEGKFQFKIESCEKIEEKDRFSSLKNEQELDVIEESLNQEGVDGLLKWVENLPEEMSGSPMISSKGFAL